jgi:hypothetical protein
MSFLKSANLDTRKEAGAAPEIGERRPTWLPPSWFGGKYHDFYDEDYDITFETKCAADSVLEAHRRLRIRGLRVDGVSSRLIAGLSTTGLTAGQIWNSEMGSYLLDCSGADMENPPPEVIQVLVGLSDDTLDEFRDNISAAEDALSIDRLLDSAPTKDDHSASNAEQDNEEKSSISEEKESSSN